jgi:hypothetical protein
MVYLKKGDEMGNKMTDLPTDVDSFLMDIAQMLECDGASLDFSNIHSFAETATSGDVAEIRENMNIMADYDFDISEHEVEVAYKNIVYKIKGDLIKC